MTGPEHYREAERLIGQGNDAMRDAATEPGARIRAHEMLITTAQVHATLALAAATAQNIRRNGAVAEVAAGTWNEVLSS